MTPDTKTAVHDALAILNYEHGKVAEALRKADEAIQADDKIELENSITIARYTLEALQVTAEKLTDYVLGTKVLPQELKLVD
jgi:gamma-glutamyl:cysteine ligase YbdK (ATP-grasp superfamily)